LKKAQETGCFNSKVNLKYMELFQMIEIIALTMTVLFIPYITKKESKKRNIHILLFMVIVVLCINGYMAINVYDFYNEIKNCPLMNTWNKWWLYWEGIASTISSLRGILVVGLILTIISKKRLKQIL